LTGSTLEEQDIPIHHARGNTMTKSSGLRACARPQSTRRTTLSTVLALALLLPAALCLAAAQPITEQVHEMVLDNGMHVLLVQRPGTPNIAAGWVAHVGSSNERPGITGISHLFEHMMFKGSPRIGTKDNKLDAKLRAKLDAVRSQMFEEERAYRKKVRHGYAETLEDASLQTEHMKALRKQFGELIEQQRKNIIKDEYDSIYTKQGATFMNAFTTEDLTAYFVQVPRNKLELWFWMESERISQPVFREFYSERDVVFEERRMRTESTPTGVPDEVFNSMFWRGSTYAWPVVGWPSDIAAITRAQAEHYFSVYYAPNNLTAAIVGDFSEKQARKWAKAYFGRIPRGKEIPPDVITRRTPQKGTLAYRAEVDAPPSASLRFPTTAFNGKDSPALTVLASVLSGKTGRLYKRMVLKDKVATQVSANDNEHKYAGEFSVSAQGVSDTTPEHLKDVLWEEITKLKKDGITDYELEKVKNQVSAAKYRRIQEPFGLLIQLLFYDGLDRWQSMDDVTDRALQVTRAQVQDAAKRYLVADRLASKLYTRKAGTQEDPQLAKFNPQQKQMIKQMLAQMKTLPKGKRAGAVQKLQAMKAKVPAPMQAVVDYVIGKLQSADQ